MSLYNGPARGGNRGGKDQFNWDNVKADKDREYYLGHSVKATTGRWQKGKDVFWYTREKQDGTDPIAAELRSVKEREEELMLEALGMKPKVKKLPVQPKLDLREMAQLTQAGEGEEESNLVAEDRMKGIGYQPNQANGSIAEEEVMAGTVQLTSNLPRVLELPPPPPRVAAAGQKRAREVDKAQRKAEKKAAKRAKKEAKKEKRAAKKAAKLTKQSAQAVSSSDDDSPSSKSADDSPHHAAAAEALQPPPADHDDRRPSTDTASARPTDNHTHTHTHRHEVTDRHTRKRSESPPPKPPTHTRRGTSPSPPPRTQSSKRDRNRQRHDSLSPPRRQQPLSQSDARGTLSPPRSDVHRAGSLSPPRRERHRGGDTRDSDRWRGDGDRGGDDHRGSDRSREDGDRHRDAHRYDGWSRRDGDRRQDDRRRYR